MEKKSVGPLNITDERVINWNVCILIQNEVNGYYELFLKPMCLRRVMRTTLVMFSLKSPFPYRMYVL
jgi:hypothetical protein